MRFPAGVTCPPSRHCPARPRRWPSGSRMSPALPAWLARARRAGTDHPPWARTGITRCPNCLATTSPQTQHSAPRPRAAGRSPIPSLAGAARRHTHGRNRGPFRRPPQDVPPDRRQSDQPRPDRTTRAAARRPEPAGRRRDTGRPWRNPGHGAARPSAPASPAGGMPGGAGTAAAPDAAEGRSGRRVTPARAASAAGQAAPARDRCAAPARPLPASPSSRTAAGSGDQQRPRPRPAPPARLGVRADSSARCRNRAGREAGPGGKTATPVRAPARALDWDANGIAITISGPGIRGTAS